MSISPKEVVLANGHFTPTRLVSLYSDFSRLQLVNPEGYEANLIAWRSVISELFAQKALSDICSIDAVQLVDQLTLPRVGKPADFAFVLDVLIKERSLIPYHEFRTKKESIYRSSWFSVTGTLSWMVKQTGIINLEYKSTNRNGTLKKEHYISLKVLEEVGNRVLEHVSEGDSGYSSRLFNREQLYSEVNGLFAGLSVLDFEVLLLSLSRDRGFCCVEDNIIKFREIKTITKLESSSQALVITEEDTNIAGLKTSIDSINKRNSELENKIEQTTLKIKQCLAKNDKTQAKTYLKTRKLFESSYSTSSESLNKLLTILVKIDEASSNLITIDTLSSSVDVLKKLNSSIDFNKLDDLMVDIDEHIDQVDKVSEELGGFRNVADDEEIDEELDQMLKEVNGPENTITEETEDNSLIERLENLKVIDTPVKESIEASFEQPIAE